ncbi:MAG TPA: hypothetical protein VFC00_31905 [Micromonosporaceae bacterium]|nr:hypothetical protein [Micromonosporaceae bacterium]
MKLSDITAPFVLDDGFLPVPTGPGLRPDGQDRELISSGTTN